MDKMDKKIKKFSECKQIATEQQFKHVRLLDLSGNVICSYNPAHGKTMTLDKKFKEIELRLKNAEPGVYIMEYRARFSGREPSYKYYVGNKNFNPKDIDNAPEMPAEKVAPVADNKTNRSTEKLLSVETALDYATENARLMAENTSLQNENRDLREENKRLNAELDEMDEKEMGEPDQMEKIGGWAKNLGDILLPVADRLVDLKEKQLNFAREKYLSDNGYDISQLSKNGSAKKEEGRDFNKKVPNVNDPDWGDYLDWLSGLSDRSFTNHLSIVKQASQEVYDAVCSEFEVSFEEDENAQEKTEE